MKKACSIFRCVWPDRVGSIGCLLLFGTVLFFCSGCAAGAKPGEATITGGNATATRHDDDGWEIVIEKAAPQRLQPVEVTLEIVEGPR
jgi:hypothetical protein